MRALREQHCNSSAHKLQVSAQTTQLSPQCLLISSLVFGLLGLRKRALFLVITHVPKMVSVKSILHSRDQNLTELWTKKKKYSLPGDNALSRGDLKQNFFSWPQQNISLSHRLIEIDVKVLIVNLKKGYHNAPHRHAVVITVKTGLFCNNNAVTLEN